MNPQISILKKQIRAMLLFFMTALFLSGATAIPVYYEIRLLLSYITAASFFSEWLNKVYAGLESTIFNFPFLMYGYDWLAFGHFVIAIAFIGPDKDPVKNKWVIDFGLIACVLIIPYAFGFSLLHGIPYWWTLIDCSFGVFGFIPLWICRNKIMEMGKLIATDKLNVIF